MIIYGWNTKNIKEAPIENECINCGEKNAHIVILSHYAHVFWIPLFPYKKSAHIVCASCQQSMEDTDYSKGSEMRNNLKQLKGTVPTPKYLYIGLVALIIGIGAIAININQNQQQEKAYIENPEIGDVYIIKDPDEQSSYNHYLLKVVDIDGDSLHVSFNSFVYDGVISSLDPKDGFYDVWYSLHKDQVKSYEESGDLRKVIREYTDLSGFNRLITYPDSLGVE